MGKILITVLLISMPSKGLAQTLYDSPDRQDLKEYLNAEFSPKNPAESASYLWLSFGPGISIKGGFSGVAGIGYQYNPGIILIRAAGTSDNSMENSVTDIGVLLGYGINETEFHASFLIGLSRVKVVRTEGMFSDSQDIPPMVGVPLQIEFILKRSEYHGFGLSLMANINKEESYGAIAVVMHLGNLL